MRKNLKLTKKALLAVFLSLFITILFNIKLTNKTKAISVFQGKEYIGYFTGKKMPALNKVLPAMWDNIQQNEVAIVLAGEDPQYTSIERPGGVNMGININNHPIVKLDKNQVIKYFKDHSNKVLVEGKSWKYGDNYRLKWQKTGWKFLLATLAQIPSGQYQASPPSVAELQQKAEDNINSQVKFATLQYLTKIDSVFNPETREHFKLPESALLDTAYNGDYNDIIQYKIPRTHKVQSYSIILWDYNNKPAVIIRGVCANPFGDLSFTELDIEAQTESYFDRGGYTPYLQPTDQKNGMYSLAKGKEVSQLYPNIIPANEDNHLNFVHTIINPKQEPNQKALKYKISHSVTQIFKDKSTKTHDPKKISFNLVQQKSDPVFVQKIIKYEKKINGYVNKNALSKNQKIHDGFNLNNIFYNNKGKADIPDGQEQNYSKIDYKKFFEGIDDSKLSVSPNGKKYTTIKVCSKLSIWKEKKDGTFDTSKEADSKSSNCQTLMIEKPASLKASATIDVELPNGTKKKANDNTDDFNLDYEVGKDDKDEHKIIFKYNIEKWIPKDLPDNSEKNHTVCYKLFSTKQSAGKPSNSSVSSSWGNNCSINGKHYTNIMSKTSGMKSTGRKKSIAISEKVITKLNNTEEFSFRPSDLNTAITGEIKEELKKYFSFKPINSTSFKLCRIIGHGPTNKWSYKKNKILNSINQNITNTSNTACVTIKIKDGKTKEGVYTIPMKNIVHPTDRIKSANYNDFLSYVIRKKQYSFTGNNVDKTYKGISNYNGKTGYINYQHGIDCRGYTSRSNAKQNWINQYKNERNTCLAKCNDNDKTQCKFTLGDSLSNDDPLSKYQSDYTGDCCSWRCGRYSCSCVRSYKHREMEQAKYYCTYRRQEKGTTWTLSEFGVEPKGLAKDGHYKENKMALNEKNPKDFYTTSHSIDGKIQSYSNNIRGTKLTNISDRGIIAKGSSSKNEFEMVNSLVTPKNKPSGSQFKYGGIESPNIHMSNLPVGTKFCMAVSVGGPDKGIKGKGSWHYVTVKETGFGGGNTKDHSTTNEERKEIIASNQWAHSVPRCTIVAKRPHFQVLSNGLLVGRKIESILNSRFINDNNWNGNITKTHGSFSEYHAASGELISKDFRSNSYYSKYLKTKPFKDGHQLTFGNKNNYGKYDGLETRDKQIKSLIQVLEKKCGSEANCYNTDSNKKAKGNFVISKNMIPKYNNKDVFNYKPNIILAKGDVIINGDVDQIDAWIIATGTVYTCQKDIKTGDSEGSNINSCNNQLVINGPVVTSKIKLRRTFGGGKDFYNNVIKNQLRWPAEVFNMRPSDYAWSYYTGLRSGKIHTVYLRDVAPRY